MLLPHTDSRQNSKGDSEELSVTSPPSDDKTPKSTASSDSSEDEQGGTISELKLDVFHGVVSFFVERLPKLRHVSCRRDSSNVSIS